MPQIALRPFMPVLCERRRVPSRARATIPPQQCPGLSRSLPISARLAGESSCGWETREPLAALSDPAGAARCRRDRTMTNPQLRTPFGLVELRPVSSLPATEGLKTYVLLPELDELLGLPGFGVRDPILADAGKKRLFGFLSLSFH